MQLLRFALLAAAVTVLAWVAGASADSSPETPAQAAQEVIEGEAPEAEVPALTDPEAAAELPHTDLDRAEALMLLRQTFGQVLQGTAGPFADLEVEKFLSDNVAVVQSESPESGPEAALLESTIPLRAANDAGEAERVDLALQSSGDALEADNGLVEATLPTELGDGIELPETGVVIEIEDMAAERNASMADESVAFYPNVSSDSDLALALTPTGVETLTQLRSADAPTSQTFQLSLPPGAELLALKGGGAEVVDGAGTPLVTIPAPSALDASGEPVPVQLAVSGDSLTLEVTPGADAAFPILVDPLFEVYEWGGNATAGLNDWIGEHNVGSPFTQAYKANCTSWCSGYIPDGRPGLWVSAAAGWNNAPGWGGSLNYFVPRWLADWNALNHSPTSYISYATYYGPGFWRRGDYNASPYVIAGLWWPEGSKWLSSWSHGGNEGNLYMGETWGFPGENTAKQAVFGLISSDTHNLSSGREAYIGYITIELSDQDKPEPGSVGAVPGWVNNQATAFSFKFTDPGLGVYSITAKDEAGHSWTTQAGCSGGASNACLRTWSSTDAGLPTVKYDPSIMPQGIGYLELSASDPIGHQTNQPLGSKPANIVKAQIKVDHTAPAITLAGSMTEQGKLGTKLGSYTLSASASDGIEGAPQSGITKTAIEVDGKVVDEATPGCTTQNCSISREWTLDSSKYAAGTHTVKVTATDAVGLTRTKEISIYLQQAPAPTVSLSGTMTEQEAIGTTRPRYKLAVKSSAQAGQHGLSTYASSFGSYGTANGLLNHPAGMAVDSKGFLWVVDRGNSRVQKFKEPGEYVTKFGASGTAAGKLNNPADLAIDPKGNFWIANTGNNRIEVFNEKREFVAYYGLAGPGSNFSEPEGIAADAKGNVWVADTNNARLVKLNGAGESVAILANKGELVEPTGIDIDPDGEIWVADRAQNKVLEFDEAGKLQHQYGSEGSAPLQFKGPDTIDVDMQGNVWIGDEGNDRVQELNEDGEYVAQFGSEGSGSGQFGFSYPMGLATDSKGAIFVADVANNRIQKWQMPSYVPIVVGAAGSEGVGAGQFRHPAGMALDAQGNIWVADRNNLRLVQLNQAGEYARSLGPFDAYNGEELNYPSDVAVDPEGDIWAVDTGHSRIVEYSESGKLITKFGTQGSGSGQLLAPESLAIDAQGHVWVADTYNARLQEFTQKGERIRTVGSFGYGQGKFVEPTGIAIGPGGNVWVVDWFNNQVTELDPEGKFILNFGTEGSGAGKFKHADAIDVDSKGNVWVADEKNNRVQEFNHAGEYVAQFGMKGTGEGQFTFSYPIGLVTDPDGNIWVSDPGNNRIEKWNYSSTTSEIKTEVKIDGKQVEFDEASCVSKTCPLDENWTLNSPSFAPGEHVVQIKATDGLGRSTIKTLGIGVQRDTTKPTLEVNGELVNAPEGWVEQQSYGLDATAQDKGYGLTALSFKIDGSMVASETQICPEGGCDGKLKKQISMSPYSGGAHEAELTSTDGAGNSTIKRWTINVDPSGEISTTEAIDTLTAVETTNSAIQPVASVDEVLEPEQIAAGDNPGLVHADGSLESIGVPDTTSIDLDTNAVTIEGPDGMLEIIPVNNQPSEEPEITANVAAVSSTVSAGTDTTVRPEYDGSLLFETIREPASPETFRWHVNLESGQILKKDDGEYAEVDYKDGTEAFLIYAEIAHDALGTTVPTHLTVDGQDIVLTVEHRSGKYVYPIVAGQQIETSYIAPTIMGDEIEKASGEAASKIPPELLAQAEKEVTPGVSTPDVPAPPYPPEESEEASASKVKYRIFKVEKYTVCGSDCDHWEIWIANPKEKKPIFMRGRNWAAWYPGTVVEWGWHQAWWFAPFISVEENDGGFVGPNVVVKGESRHLTAWSRFTVTANVIVNGDANFSVTNYLAPQIWVWPNGFQQHELRHWKPKIEVQEA